MKASSTAQNMRGGALMHKKVPCIELTFSVFLLSFLLLFTNVNLASAQEMRDAQDCASNQVPEIGEILRLGLTPSLKDSEGVDLSPELRVTCAESASPNKQSSIESDAQLSAKRVGQRAMYRLYNPYTGEHFYTADEQERDDVAAAGWNKESIGWVAPKTSSTPVYRLYNKYAWDHHYTPSADERDNLVKKGWIDEGIGWYSADEGSLFRAPVYRQYNPNAWVGTHNYTLSTSELNNLVKAGWRDEGVGYYGLDQSLMSELDFNDIKVTTTSKVYNGKAQTQTITSTNQKLDEDYIVEYANNKNVGTATITITGINGFYGEKVYTFKITQKTISQVKWGDLEFGYDGKAHIPTATAVGLCSGDSATITVTASGNHTDTGTYTATATAISNKNYKLASGLKTDFRIGTKIDFDKDNKPTVNTNDEVYTGSAITKDVSVAGLTKDKDYTVTYTNNVNVGTATLTIKGIGEYFGEKSYTFKITQKSLSGAAITPEALTYNGSEQTVKISKVTLDGKTLKEGTDFQVVSGNKGANAGTYEGLTLKGIGNYKDTASGSWAISPKTVGIDWSDTSITYDGTPKSPTAKVTGVCGSDAVTATVVVIEAEHTNTGTYNATATELDNANYQLPNPNPATTFVIVAKEPTEEETKDIKLSLPGVAYVYDKTEKKPGVVGIPAQFTSGTDYEIVYSDNVNAGENTAKVTVKFKGNYTGEKVLTFSIEKATLTINWSNTTFTYDSKTHAPTAEIASGKIDGDTITLSVSGAQTNANESGKTYTANVFLDTASQVNYKIAEDDKATTFTISPLSIVGATIVLDSNTLTYNASTQTKGVVSVRVGELTLTSSDYDLSGNTAKGAGDHTMTFTGKGNFTGTATTSFSINKAPLKIKWSNTSLTYNATAQSPTAEIESGKQGSDSITLNVSGEQTNANSTTTPSYTATASLDSTSANNYVISENEKTTFTIAKAELKLKWSNTSFTYDATSKSPSAEIVSGKKGSDTVTLSVSGAQTNANKTGESYTATATLDATSQENYRIATGHDSVTFTIAKAIPAYTAPTSFVGYYGEILSEVTFTQPANGDFSWDASTTVLEELGDKQFTITFTPKDTDNYETITGITSTVTVKREVLNRTKMLNLLAGLENKPTSLMVVKGNNSALEGLTSLTTDGIQEDGMGEIGVYQSEDKSTVYIASMGARSSAIFAPEDCSSLFSASANLNLTSLTNLSCANLNTSLATNMNAMFEGCETLVTLDVAGFNTSNVTDMTGMFSGCKAVTSLNVSGFNTSNVTDMTGMFSGCEAVTSLNVAGFDTSKVPDMTNMFNLCGSLSSLDLSNFDTSKVTSMECMFNGCSSLTSLKVSKFNTSEVTNMSSMFNGCKNVTSLNVSKFDTSKVTTMKEMFKSCSKVYPLDVSNFDTSNVTDMEGMFNGCSSLDEIDVSEFDTSKVTTMASMFRGCSDATELKVSKLNTSQVADMTSMFELCVNLQSVDLTNFDTSNVTTMNGMFFGCTQLNDVSVKNFKTSKVTDMSSMFTYCSALSSVDLTKFDTSNVETMSGMFSYCSSFQTLNLASFNTKKVTNMAVMFYQCTSLVTIYVSRSGFVTTSVTESADIFGYCNKLVGGAGTKWGYWPEVWLDFARIDQGPSSTSQGYFTEGTV